MIRQLFYAFLFLFFVGCSSNTPDKSNDSNKTKVEISKDRNEKDLRKILRRKGIDYA